MLYRFYCCAQLWRGHDESDHNMTDVCLSICASNSAYSVSIIVRLPGKRKRKR